MKLTLINEGMVVGSGLSPEKVDALERMFGLGKYKPEPIVYTCPKCGSNDVRVWESGADTGFDEMEGMCRQCHYNGCPSEF